MWYLWAVLVLWVGLLATSINPHNLWYIFICGYVAGVINENYFKSKRKDKGD